MVAENGPAPAAEVDGPIVVEREGRAGVAWYDPKSFAAWRASGVAAISAFARWEDWFDAYQRTFMALHQRGVKPLKVVVRATPLGDWLTGQGRADDLAGRTAYVAWLFEQMGDR